MKYPLLFLLLTCIFSACESKKQGTPHAEKIDVFPISYDYEQLQGVYSGDFGDNNIHINLRNVTGRNVSGYSIVKGLKRNLSGIMEAKGNEFHMVLKEPGNNPYDGVFDITIDTTDFDLQGKWSPKNPKATNAKIFSLKKIIGNKAYLYSFSFSDSLHSLLFNENGQCTYEFYNEENGVKAEQMTIVRGGWSKKNNVYTINWQNNDIIEEKESILPVDSLISELSPNDYNLIIRFNGRILTNEEY